MQEKIIFLADLFKNQALGGAELHDDVVIKYFEKKEAFYEKINCHLVTTEYIEKNLDKIWFISNFANLSFTSIALLSKKAKYVIYEHDYKFIDVRNPIHFKDFLVPKRNIINYNFYRNAKKVICLSKMHRKIFQDNLNLENIVNINCSMWSDEDLSLFEKLQHSNNQKDLFAVIDSPNPLKKTKETIVYCENNSIPYELIKSKKYTEFISILSRYRGLIFRTNHPEPTPRVAIEAKMLGIKFLSQKHLISVAHEDYFDLKGLAMIECVRKMRENALKKISKWCNE